MRKRIVSVIIGIYCFSPIWNVGYATENQKVPTSPYLEFSNQNTHEIEEIPTDLQKNIPEDADISAAYKVKLRKIPMEGFVVCYSLAGQNGVDETSTVMVFVKKNDKWINVLHKDFETEFSRISGPFALIKGDPTDYFFLEHGMGASIGWSTDGYRWDGETLMPIPSKMFGWGFRLKDINGDGIKEVLIYNRYGLEMIFVYKDGKFIESDTSFPDYKRFGRDEN